MSSVSVYYHSKQMIYDAVFISKLIKVTMVDETRLNRHTTISFHIHRPIRIYFLFLWKFNIERWLFTAHDDFNNQFIDASVHWNELNFDAVEFRQFCIFSKNKNVSHKQPFYIFVLNNTMEINKQTTQKRNNKISD